MLFGDGITVIGALMSLIGRPRGLASQSVTAESLPPAEQGSAAESSQEEWPEDRDAVPGWRLRQEQRARDCGYDLPGYRTRAQFDSWVDACRARLDTKPLPPLPPDQAALEFLAHLEGLGAGTYSSERLTEQYLDFWREQNREPAPENFMRQHLRRMTGRVSTTTTDGRCDGKRVRSIVWTIRGQRHLSEAA